MWFFGLSLLSLALPLVALAGHDKMHLDRNHYSIARRAPGEVQLHRRFGNSRWSFYDAETGQAGACGRFIRNSDFVVALNTPQYGLGYPGPQCFKTITLRYNGKTATAQILDQCPGCPYGGLDLTEGLFAYFAPHSVGIIYAEWEFGSGGGNAAPTTTRQTTASVWHASSTTPHPTFTWHTTSSRRTGSSSTPPRETPTSSSSEVNRGSRTSSTEGSSRSASTGNLVGGG